MNINLGNLKYKENCGNGNKFRENCGSSNRGRDVPLFNDTSKSYGEESDSLESLAQQRERILGELFGRFKPTK